MRQGVQHDHVSVGPGRVQVRRDHAEITPRSRQDHAEITPRSRRDRGVQISHETLEVSRLGGGWALVSFHVVPLRREHVAVQHTARRVLVEPRVPTIERGNLIRARSRSCHRRSAISSLVARACAAQVFAVVQCSGERRPYGCFSLTKGVVGPDGRDLQP